MERLEGQGPISANMRDDSERIIAEVIDEATDILEPPTQPLGDTPAAESVNAGSEMKIRRMPRWKNGVRCPYFSC